VRRSNQIVITNKPLPNFLHTGCPSCQLTKENSFATYLVHKILNTLINPNDTYTLNTLLYYGHYGLYWQKTYGNCCTSISTDQLFLSPCQRRQSLDCYRLNRMVLQTTFFLLVKHFPCRLLRTAQCYGNIKLISATRLQMQLLVLQKRFDAKGCTISPGINEDNQVGYQLTHVTYLIYLILHTSWL